MRVARAHSATHLGLCLRRFVLTGFGANLVLVLGIISKCWFWFWLFFICLCFVCYLFVFCLCFVCVLFVCCLCFGTDGVCGEKRERGREIESDGMKEVCVLFAFHLLQCLLLRLRRLSGGHEGRVG